MYYVHVYSEIMAVIGRVRCKGVGLGGQTQGGGGQTQGGGVGRSDPRGWGWEVRPRGRARRTQGLNFKGGGALTLGGTV